MTIATVLKAGLTANSGISAIVGTRIYPLVFVTNNPTLPAITYQRISNSGQDGTSDRRQSRWQINCWATTHLAATTLSAAVKTFAEEWHAVSQTPSVEFALVVGEYEDYDDSTKIFRTIIDVMLTTKGD